MTLAGRNTIAWKQITSLSLSLSHSWQKVVLSALTSSPGDGGRAGRGGVGVCGRGGEAGGAHLRVMSAVL